MDNTNGINPTPVVIYHGNCMDGFGALWAIHKQGSFGTAEFYPGVYGTPPPDVKGRHVIMVDFSYKRPVIERMIREARSILILDHHKTAEQELAGLPEAPDWHLWNVAAPWVEGMTWARVGVRFDMEKSGAVLAWEYFHSNKPVPTLLRFVQDRDLRRFDLPHSREVNAVIASYDYDLDQWSKLADDLEGAPIMEDRGVVAEGTAIIRKTSKDIHEFVQAAGFMMTLDGHEIPCANVPYMWASEVGHIMCPGYPFAATYFDRGNERVYSLRSDKNGLDVSEIAAKFGGGGHKHAAGFTVGVNISPRRDEDTSPGVQSDAAPTT